ncbi:MAG: hypothetical protein ABIB71_03640 [Candidatus Woesearchaeota archaeon]
MSIKNEKTSMDGLLSRYEDALKGNIHPEEIYYACRPVLLNPEEINEFLQSTAKYAEEKEYHRVTGPFITQLIQNSHDAGNNKFTLNTKALTEDLNFLGDGLLGRGNGLLEIMVDGNVGHECFIWAKDIKRISISGDAGALCGWQAENIRDFYIERIVGAYCGVGAEHSTFKTPNQETLQLLKESVPKGKGNRIYFINPNKEEDEIRW